LDSQHGSIGSKKSDTLQKLVAGQPEHDPQNALDRIHTGTWVCGKLHINDTE
jgi:hypothetical protein